MSKPNLLQRIAGAPPTLALVAIAGILGVTGVLGAGGGATAWAQTAIDGTVFADVTDKQNKDDATGAKSSDSGVGTDVKRFYITVTHPFDGVWSAMFQTDIGDESGKRYDLFVKRAYIQARIAPEAIFRLGDADTPWAPFVDDLWGYRYVENELIDRLGFGTTVDWGLALLGNLDDKLINYQVSMLNGKGFNNPTRSKTVDFEGRLGIQPVAGLNFAVGAYSGKRGLETSSTPALHTAARYDAVAAYVSDVVRVGGEYFAARDWNNVTTVAADKSDGYSAWLSVSPTQAVSIFGRYDGLKPSKDLDPRLSDTYYNAGVQYRFNPSFAASLVYKNEVAKNGTVTSVNGTIGSANAAGKGTFREIGVFTFYTF